MKWLLTSALVLVAMFGGPLAILTAGRVSGGEWWNASREPIGLAPDPAQHPEAIVQVYAARAYSWRGAFGVHTWISVKPHGADGYTVYEVIGWRVRRGDPALVIHNDAPDRHWYGNPPTLVADLRGDGVDDVIRRIDAAARAYPYRDTYAVWPGPNSNTFTAWVARAAPELKLDLPATAIGKDWLDTGSGQIFARTPSGTGFQFSLFGLLGVLAGVEEGIEVNFAGLTLGIDPLDLTLNLPGFGNIGINGQHASAAQPEAPAE